MSVHKSFSSLVASSQQTPRPAEHSDWEETISRSPNLSQQGYLFTTPLDQLAYRLSLQALEQLETIYHYSEQERQASAQQLRSTFLRYQKDPNTISSFKASVAKIDELLAVHTHPSDESTTGELQHSLHALSQILSPEHPCLKQCLVPTTSLSPSVACRNAFSHVFHILDSYLPSFLVVSARTVAAMPNFFFEDTTCVEMGKLTTAFLAESSLSKSHQQQLNRFYQQRILIPLQEEATKIYPLLKGMVENPLVHYYLRLLKDPNWDQKTSFSQEDLLSYSDPLELLSNYITSLDELLKRVSDLLYLVTFFPFYLKMTDSFQSLENSLDDTPDLGGRFRFLLQEIRSLKPESSDGSALPGVLRVCKLSSLCQRMRTRYLESSLLLNHLFEEVSLFKDILLSAKDHSPKAVSSSFSTDEESLAIGSESFTEDPREHSTPEEDCEEIASITPHSSPLKGKKKRKPPLKLLPVTTENQDPLSPLFSVEQQSQVAVSYCSILQHRCSNPHAIQALSHAKHHLVLFLQTLQIFLQETSTSQEDLLSFACKCVHHLNLFVEQLLTALMMQMRDPKTEEEKKILLSHNLLALLDSCRIAPEKLAVLLPSIRAINQGELYTRLSPPLSQANAAQELIRVAQAPHLLPQLMPALSTYYRHIETLSKELPHLFPKPTRNANAEPTAPLPAFHLIQKKYKQRLKQLPGKGPHETLPPHLARLQNLISVLYDAPNPTCAELDHLQINLLPRLNKEFSYPLSPSHALSHCYHVALLTRLVAEQVLFGTLAEKEPLYFTHHPFSASTHALKEWAEALHLPLSPEETSFLGEYSQVFHCLRYPNPSFSSPQSLASFWKTASQLTALPHSLNMTPLPGFRFESRVEADIQTARSQALAQVKILTSILEKVGQRPHKN